MAGSESTAFAGDCALWLIPRMELAEHQIPEFIAAAAVLGVAPTLERGAAARQRQEWDLLERVRFGPGVAEATAAAVRDRVAATKSLMEVLGRGTSVAAAAADARGKARTRALFGPESRCGGRMVLVRALLTPVCGCNRIFGGLPCRVRPSASFQTAFFRRRRSLQPSLHRLTPLV